MSMSSRRMVFWDASEKGPVSAARKYGDWEVRRDVWIRKGVALGPMSRVLVVVKSDGLALV
jgi:hypothetical protein